MQRNLAARVAALAIAVLLPSLAAGTEGDVPGEEAPAYNSAPLFDCVSLSERARAARIAAIRADPDAFRPTAVKLPPFFFTNPERTFTWAGLLYFRSSDHDAGTRTRLLAPLYFSHCAPESETVVTPLYGHRIDAEGSARLVLTFFSRRDRLADTDVLFPFVWSMREREVEGGPTVWRGGAVPPFAFWGRDDRTGAHHTFVPPLFWSWGDGERDSWIAGLAFRTRTREEWHAGLAPLYFTGGTGKSRYHLVPPLLFYRSAGEDHSTTFFANTWYDRDADGYSLAVLPFLYAGRDHRTGEHHTLVPPFFFRWGDPQVTTTIAGNVFWRERGDERRFAVVPFYFSGRSPGRWYQFVPPLVWRWGDDEQGTYTTIAGPFYGHRTPTSWHAGMAPVWLSGERGGTRYDVIPPLLFYRSSGHGVSTTVLANTWYERKKDGFTFASVPFAFAGRKEKSHYLLVPPLLAYHGGDGETETTWVLNTGYQRRPGGYTFGVAPLLLLHREGDRSTTVAGNVYVRKTPERTDLGVVPFYFRGRAGASYYDIAPPLFWRFGNERVRTLVAGLYYRHEDERGHYAGVAPLWLSSERDGVRTDVVPPLLAFRREEPGRTSWFALQTYLEQRPDGFTFTTFPFVFAGREGRSHYTLIPPLLTWHAGDGETETTLVANTFLRTTPRGHTFNFFPLVWSGRDGEAHHLHVPPLFWRWGDEAGTTTFAGPAFLRETPSGRDFGIAPLYFGGRHGDRYYDVVLPLFARWGDAEKQRTAVFVPGYHFRTDHGWHAGVLPFWFGGRDRTGRYDLVPPLLFYRDRHDEKERTRVVAVQTYVETRPEGHTVVSAPFVYSHREGPRHKLLIPPLLTWHQGDGVTESTFAVNTWYQRRQDGYTLASAPFLFVHRAPDRHHTLVPPLFWRWGNDRETTTLAGNVFWRKTPDARHFAIAPLYFRGEHPGGDYTLVPPLYWSWGDATRRTTLAGNVFFRRTPEGSHFSVFPLFFRGRSGEHHYTVVAPVAAHVGDGKTESTWVLNTFHQKRPDGFTFTSVPFAHVHRSPDRQRTFIPPLYWQWGDGVTSTTIAANVYLRTAPDERQLTVFPLLFHGHKGRRHHTYVPPLLYFHSGDGERETTWFLNAWHQRDAGGWRFNLIPLVFAARGPVSHHTFVPPLFWRWGDALSTTTVAGNVYWHQRAEKRSFGIVPFYFRSRGGPDEYDVVPPLFYRSKSATRTRITLLPLFDYVDSPGERRIVSPLFVHSRTPLHERTVVGGLYWRFSGPQTDTRVVFPFWWDVRSPQKGTRLSTVFPIYWRYQTPEETTHVLLNAMWSRGETERGESWSFHLFPFVDVASYHPDHFLWQVLAGALGRERQNDRQRWRVGWVWLRPTRIEPAATKEPAAAAARPADAT